MNAVQNSNRENASVVGPERVTSGPTFQPLVDIVETADGLSLRIDVPGVSSQNLNIEFERGVLTIHGKVSPRQNNVHYLVREYEVGDFHRSFEVRDTVDASRITAELKNGVLTLHLPKAEAVKPRKIEVHSG